tara:strand:+ start:1374 stop:1673 length:300 start_codon:yes stop_codon:yes gene_type:complete
MSNFSIRIEMVGIPASQYDLLDRALISAGFSKEIRGKDSTGRQASWLLPLGEYDYSSDSETASEVRDKVKDLGEDFCDRLWIVVTEVKTRSWSLRRSKV